MASLNLCQFMGNVGKIETRYLQNGDPVTSISLAVNKSWRNKEGEAQESTEWIRVVMFSKLAEIAEKYILKGSSLYVSGEMRTRKWQNKEGVDQYSTEIVADKMQMLGGKSSAGGNEQEGKPANKQAAPSGSFEDMDDDIPF